VFERDRRLGGEQLDQLQVLLSEQAAARLIGELQGADGYLACGQRDDQGWSRLNRPPSRARAAIGRSQRYRCLVRADQLPGSLRDEIKDDGRLLASEDGV